MSKRIEIEGVSRTVDEWRQVLAFWDHEDNHLPWCLDVVEALRPDPTEYPRHIVLRGAGPLTPELVEQIRDAVEPWQEVRRDEVQPGERFKLGLGLPECVASCPGLCMHWNTASHRHGTLRFATPVLVRRPLTLTLTLTLRDVESGAKVRAVPHAYVALAGASLNPADDHREVWVLDHHITERWPADTPVEVVEDDS